MSEIKVKQKPIPVRNLDPGIYHRAKLAALTVKQSVGAWITQAIKNRLDREKLNRDKGG